MQTPTKREAFGRVLITGATGFLGRAVAEALERAGHAVLRGARNRPAAAPAGQAWIGHGEIGPQTPWDATLADVETVVHLARAAHLPDTTMAAPVDAFARINADGTARLASAAVGAGIRRRILMSSALVHGAASPPGRPFSEEDARRERDFERLFHPLELDTRRMRTGLDWMPPMSLDEGLARALDPKSTIASVDPGRPRTSGGLTPASHSPFKKVRWSAAP